MFPKEAGKPMDLNDLVNRMIVPMLSRCAHCRNGKDESALPGHHFQLDARLPEWHGWHASRLRTPMCIALAFPRKQFRRFAPANVAATYYIKTVTADAQAARAKFETERIGPQMGNGTASTFEHTDDSKRTRNESPCHEGTTLGTLGWVKGFEPLTAGATVRSSTTELHPPQ